jgi:NMD protein affecting ribosome stability and mRNA decay
LTVFSIDVLCDQCEALSNIFVEKERRNEPHACPSCGGVAHRVWVNAPGVTNHSYVDGTRRRGFQELREANALTFEAANSTPAQRKTIEREIAKITKAKE